MLGALAVAAALGAAQLARRSGFHESRLRGMDGPALRSWTESHPDDALGHYYLGMARGRAGETRAATDQLARAIGLDPGLTGARWRLARVMAAHGQESEAESLLREGIRIDPASARLHAELGRLYEERQEFRRAAGEWQKATSLAPRDAEALSSLGRCWMAVNDEARATDAYRRAAALVPRSATYQTALAGALRLKREYAEAEQHSRRALELDPRDPDAQFGLAKLLWDRDGATPETEASMRRSVAFQPASPLLHYTLASVCQERGDLSESVREYQLTLRLLAAREPPASASGWAEREQWLARVEGPHFNLARLLRRLGRPAEAAHHLALFRRMSDYRNHAHQLLIQIATRPEEATLHFDLARVHAAAGSRRLAEEEYRAGLRVQPDPRAQAELLTLQSAMRKASRDASDAGPMDARRGEMERTREGKTDGS